MSSHVHNKVQEMICKVAQIKTALFEIFGEIQLTHKQLQKLHSEHSNNMSKSKDFIPIAPAANHAPLTRGGVKKHKKTASLKLAPKGHTSSTLSTKKKSKETPFTDAMQRVLFRFSTLVQVAIGQLICSSISSLYGTVCEERGGGKKEKEEREKVQEEVNHLIIKEKILKKIVILSSLIHPFLLHSYNYNWN